MNIDRNALRLLLIFTLILLIIACIVGCSNGLAKGEVTDRTYHSEREYTPVSSIHTGETLIMVPYLSTV